MGGEPHPLLCQLAQVRKAHHLEPARVRQDGLVPVHETVQATQTLDPFGAGAQHKVIGIAEQDIRARRRHTVGQHGLDGRRRAHGHESRRADFPARGRDAASARKPVGGVNVKGEPFGHGRFITPPCPAGEARKAV